MSSWSEIRARTTDPLSSTINSLIMRQNQANAISDEITDADTIFPVRILNSKLSLDDKNLTVGYAKPVSQAFFLPFEPDGDVVKLWSRFDSGGVNVVDYSCFRNNIEVRHDDEAGAPQPHLIMTAEDDGVAKNKISSFLQRSKKHYFRITDPQFSLQEGDKSFSFFFKILPFILTNVIEHGKRAVLLDYIENDQVSHAVRVELDDSGFLYFFVRWNYVDYFVKSDAPVIKLPDLPDFYSEDYDPEDYFASTQAEDDAAVVDLSALGMSYIFCTFDKDTKVATILHPYLDEDEEEVVVDSWTSDTLSIPYTSNLSLWMPLSEGGGTIAYDVSGMGNNGDFAATTAAPTWITSIQGKHHLSFDSTDRVDIPNSASLNTFTSFTVSFFVKTGSSYLSGSYKHFVGKDSETFANGGWRIYGETGASSQLNFEAKNAGGTTRGIYQPGCLTANSTLYHVVVTYDGTNYKLYVDKVLKATLSGAGDTLTNSGNTRLGTTDSGKTFSGNLYQVQIWKNKALTLAEIGDLYDVLHPYVDDLDSGIIFNSSTTAIWPPGWDDPPEPPAPGTPFTLPFTQTAYDQQSGTNYSAVRPVTVSGLTQVYSVAGGTPVSDPVVLQYDVGPGVASGGGGGGGLTEIYNLAGASSNGALEDDEKAYGQRIATTSSVLYNKTITDITIYLKDGSPVPSGGTMNIGIIKNDGSTIAFGAAVTVSDITSSYVAFNRAKSDNTYVMAVGDAVGVFWTGGSGQLNVQRGGSGNHFENSSYSSQCIHNGTSWGSYNTSFSMAAIIKTGTTGPPPVDPYLQIVSGNQVNYAVGEVFPSGSPMVGITPTKIELRVHRHASAAGTITLRHVDSSNVTKTNGVLKTTTVSTLPTTVPTTFNYVWEDLTYSNPIAANDRILVTLSGGNSNPVYVLGNEGATVSPTSYDGTRSYVVYRKSGFPGFIAESWVTNTARDISGKMSSGGNDFTGYINLDGTRKRTGIKVDTDTSSLKTKKITKVTATLKKVGTPAAGAIYCRIRDADGSIRETLNQTDITAVSTSDTSIDFINTTHNTSLELDDTLSIEYELGDASNYVSVRINKNQFEGVNTILFESLSASINTAAVLADRDLAAVLYTGGETDLAARPRVGLSVNNSNSSLWGKAITKVRLWLKREGSTFDPDDEFSVKIIRGSDKATVATLGTMEILDLDAVTGTPYDFENVGNSYVMANGDMIVVESLFGNASNFVWVKRSATQVIDDTSTCLVDWNSTAYNLTTDQDLNMIAWTGGYTVYPDPNIPTPPTPYHYSHEMFFGSATTADSEAEVEPSTLEPDNETMFDFIAADLRLYQGRLIEEEEAINLFVNKYTISALNFSEVDTVAHSLVGENP